MGVVPPARGGLRVAGDQFEHRVARGCAFGGTAPVHQSRRTSGGASRRVMLYYLLEPFFDDFILFNLFSYITVRAGAGMATSLFLSFLFGPRVIRWLRRLRVGQVVREE